MFGPGDSFVSPLTDLVRWLPVFPLAGVFVSVPLGAWQTLGFLMEMMPRPLVTRSQVDLMAIDSVASPECPGFANLGIEPRPIDSMW
jgi:hypothetical protein